MWFMTPLFLLPVYGSFHFLLPEMEETFSLQIVQDEGPTAVTLSIPGPVNHLRNDVNRKVG